MRKLLRHEFEPDPAVDGQRGALARRGDELFEEVMRSAGAMKEWALRRFNEHNSAVQAFLARHRGYFAAKRAHYMQFSGLGAIGRAEREEAGRFATVRRNARAMVLVAGMFALLQGCAMAQGVVKVSFEQKAILAIIGEAEGEGFEGMLAVAGAIRNRGSFRGVYGLKAQRVRKHLYSQKTYDLARTAWVESESLDESNGATGWGNEEDLNKFCSEAWWHNCVITAHIGRHWFYRRKR